jgi:hypothetical protein
LWNTVIAVKILINEAHKPRGWDNLGNLPVRSENSQLPQLNLTISPCHLKLLPPLQREKRRILHIRHAPVPGVLLAACRGAGLFLSRLPCLPLSLSPGALIPFPPH